MKGKISQSDQIFIKHVYFSSENGQFKMGICESLKWREEELQFCSFQGRCMAYQQSLSQHRLLYFYLCLTKKGIINSTATVLDRIHGWQYSTSHCFIVQKYPGTIQMVLEDFEYICLTLNVPISSKIYIFGFQCQFMQLRFIF